MPKIWFQKHTILGRFPWLDAAYDAHFKALLPEDTIVRQQGLPGRAFADALPANYVEFGQAETFFGWEFARQSVGAERAGYDAYVIGASQDPGLSHALSLTSIPVIGYGRQTFSLLASQRIQFGIVGFIPALEAPISANMRTQGVSSSCVGFEYMPGAKEVIGDALANSGDVRELVSLMDRAAEKLKARGADVVVCGEGLENELLWAAGVRETGGLPVIDSNGLTVVMADALARARAAKVWDVGANSYERRRLAPSVVRHLQEVFMP